MKLLVLDNYDSFTYNLVHLLEKTGVDDVDVFRNDKITIEDAGKYDKIVLSPGPGLPSEAGIMNELVKTYAKSKSILGVCLGHQCIAEVFGGSLINLDVVHHGVAADIKIISQEERLFKGLPQKFKVGRYHSWVADPKTLPDDLEVTATDEEGEIMALRHKKHDVRGVQFHPESILTEYGEELMRNWLKT